MCLQVKLSADQDRWQYLGQLTRVLQSVVLTKITNATNEALYQGVKFVSFAV